MNPFTLPRRVRLVRLLHARGFRDAERLREDELQKALERLDTLTHAMGASTDTPTSPSSAAHVGTPQKHVGPPQKAAPDPRLMFEDPDALPRFREPKIFLPEGERTFLRLVAVDSDRLFLTWDLGPDADARIDERGVRVLIDVLDDERATTPHEVDARIGRWYVPAPGPRLSVIARLVNADGVVLAESNPAIVPANAMATSGPLVFATLPPSFDRRQTAHGPLLTGNDAPVEAAREERGIYTPVPTVFEFEGEESLPNSATRVHRMSYRLMPPNADSEADATAQVFPPPESMAASASSIRLSKQGDASGRGGAS